MLQHFQGVPIHARRYLRQKSALFIAQFNNNSMSSRFNFAYVFDFMRRRKYRYFYSNVLLFVVFQGAKPGVFGGRSPGHPLNHLPQGFILTNMSNATGQVSFSIDRNKGPGVDFKHHWELGGIQRSFSTAENGCYALSGYL